MHSMDDDDAAADPAQKSKNLFLFLHYYYNMLDAQA